MHQIFTNFDWLITDWMALGLTLLGFIFRRLYRRNRRATALTGVLGIGLALSGIGLAVGPRIEAKMGQILTPPELVDLVYLEPANVETVSLNEYLRVTVDSLNIRNGPGKEWRVLAMADEGTRLACQYCLGPIVEISGRRGRWCKILSKTGKVGYVWGVYVNRTGDLIDESISAN